MNGRERLAALDQSMNLYKTARQHLDNDPSDRNVQRYVLAQAGLLSKLAEVAELDMAEAKERREPHAPVLVEPVVAPAPVLGMYTDADRAALQQARDAVQPAVDAAVVAAVAAIEAERDSAYAQRDAARAKALDEIGVIIANDLAETEDTIARGKGTWPQRDYITDERWACIAERRSVFAAIMRKLSGMRLAEPTPNDAAFYRVGQTGVERALPVADAPEWEHASCATCGRDDVPCRSDGLVWTCRDCEPAARSA